MTSRVLPQTSRLLAWNCDADADTLICPTKGVPSLPVFYSSLPQDIVTAPAKIERTTARASTTNMPYRIISTRW